MMMRRSETVARFKGSDGNKRPGYTKEDNTHLGVIVSWSLTGDFIQHWLGSELAHFRDASRGSLAELLEGRSLTAKTWGFGRGLTLEKQLSGRRNRSRPGTEHSQIQLKSSLSDCLSLLQKRQRR